MSRSEASETLLICDGCSLTVHRLPEGKFKVRPRLMASGFFDGLFRHRGNSP